MLMSDAIQEIEALEADSGKSIYKVGELPIIDGATHGSQKIKEIGQHSPMGPGDVWFYQVIFDDDSGIRVYNMTKVYFGKPKKPSAIVVPENKIIV